MKKLFLPAVLICIFLVVIAGCKSSSSSPSSPAPTATSSPTPQIYVSFASAGYIYSGSTYYNVGLQVGDANGNSITGATVDINGNSLTMVSPGVYHRQEVGIIPTPGATVIANISCSNGSISASSIWPPKVTILTPANGSNISRSADLNIQWSYIGGTPQAIILQVIVDSTGYVNQTLPGTTTNYTVPANTLPSSGTVIIMLIATNTASFYNAAAGSQQLTVTQSAMTTGNMTP